MGLPCRANVVIAGGGILGCSLAYLSTIDAGADSEDYSHDGAEVGLVLSGTLELWVAGRHFVLQEGDSFAFKSTEVHRCANPSQQPTRVLRVITPPHY